MEERKANVTEDIVIDENKEAPAPASASASASGPGADSAKEKKSSGIVGVPKTLKAAGRKKAVKRKSGDIVTDSIDSRLAKEEAANREANVRYAKDPELHGHSRLQMRAREYAFAVLAVIIGSLGTVGILLPNGLTIGGITGIARIIQNYTGWNYSLVYYALSLLITAIVWMFLGFKEVRKIIFMAIAYPTVMFFMELGNIVLVESDDLFLVAVFTGVLYGISNGMTFKAGFSSGGTDSLAKVIKYRWLPHLGINDITFAVNAVIVIASAFVFGVNIALYAIIITYISMKVGEAVMYGFSDKIVELDIIPGDPDALTEYIMNELGRGVSSIEITGEYTGDKRKQLKILCSPRESFLIKRHLAKNDPKSFVSVFRVNSVWGVGRGFSDIREIDG